MSRTFIILSVDNFLHNEYVSPNVEYRLVNIRDTVYFCRNTEEISCTYMNTSKFKRALREGIIIFTD